MNGLFHTPRTSLEDGGLVFVEKLLKVTGTLRYNQFIVFILRTLGIAYTPFQYGTIHLIAGYIVFNIAYQNE
jgi:hypothetical protein